MRSFNLILSSILLIISQTAYAQNRQGFFNSNKQNLSHLEVEITNEVLPWFDSLSYRFQVVTFSGIPIYSSKNGKSKDLVVLDTYSEHFSGPIFLKDDNCTIYPIFCQAIGIDTTNNTQSLQALFCMEDLARFSDVITVYCRGYSGYTNESQMNTIHVTKKLKVKEKWSSFEENKSYPVATEVWFQAWRKVHFGDPHTRIWYLDKRHYCN